MVSSQQAGMNGDHAGTYHEATVVKMVALMIIATATRAALLIPDVMP